MSRNRSASTTSRRSSTDGVARLPGVAGRLLLTLLALFAALGPGWAGTVVTIGDRARAVLADPRYQHGFPSLPQGSETGPPGRSRRYPGDIAPGDVDPAPSLSRVPLSALSTFAVILGAVVVAAGVGWLLGLRRMRPGPAAPPVPDPEGDGTLLRRGKMTGDEADRLAAEGRWADALHALLLQAIRSLSERSPTPLPPSFTSRELLALAPLSGEARQAFAAMVRAVEGAWFGGLPVGPEDYRENRERFQRIAAEAG